jgi:signal transduction histidine kinase
MAYYSNLRTIYLRSRLKLIQDTQVIVKVKDTGTGIDQEILPRLFSTFASKSFEEAHDGKIRSENININTRREKAATFYFTLPTINRQQNVKVVKW